MATAAGIAAWLSGQPHVGAEAKRVTGVKGDIDHFLALVYLRGLLTVLHDAGHPGLLLVLDEVETLQRVRSDARAKALNELRRLLDDIDGGRFPGLYLMITGTPAFFDGRQGVQLLPPTSGSCRTPWLVVSVARSGWCLGCSCARLSTCWTGSTSSTTSIRVATTR